MFQEGPHKICGIYVGAFMATLYPSVHGATGRSSFTHQVLGWASLCWEPDFGWGYTAAGPPIRVCSVGWYRVALEGCWATAWHHRELQLPQHDCGPECGSPGNTTAPHGAPRLGERKATGEMCSPEIMEKTNAPSLLGFFCISFHWDKIWMSPHHPCMLLKSFPHASPFPSELVLPLCSQTQKPTFTSASFSDAQKALCLHKCLEFGLKIMRINNFIPKALPLLMNSERTVLYI